MELKLQNGRLMAECLIFKGIPMTNNLEHLINSIDNLEKLLNEKLSNNSKNFDNELFETNQNLKKELEVLKQDYQKLEKTSKEVLEELNNSIEIIENHLKLKNANN